MVSSPWENASPAQRTDWAIRSTRVITPEGERAAAVLVRDERIAAVVPPLQIPTACPILDVGDLVVIPGLVDTHVHINEPGRTEWEGFETATRAAAAGGITTLIDMPLNSSPVTTKASSLDRKLAAAERKLWVDCGFYGGIVPGNADDIVPLIGAGVLGFKAFLCHSGIDEFPAATAADLRSALPHLAAAGLPLLAHAELVAPLPPDIEAKLSASPRSYAAYLASRPRAWEHTAIRLLIELCREQRSHVHIVHLASADALPMIADARLAGLPLTVETCPHYLFFAAEEIPDGQTLLKCAPPIRERENRERLWQALRNQLIDTIVSDHSPAPFAVKCFETGDLQKAWGGVASLQLGLSAIWTAARGRGFSLVDVVRWMSQHPAQLIGLGRRKGALAAGCDADIVVFDPNVSWVVISDRLHHRHKATPYEDQTLHGRVAATFLRGRKICVGERVADAPTGRILLRSKR
jgi:allantoinase